MLRIVALAMLLALSLFGANLVEAEAKAKGESVVLHLRFDAPFVGKVARKRSEKETILLLEGARLPAARSIEAADVEIELRPQKERSLILLHAPQKPASIHVRRSDDRRGLEIEFGFVRSHSHEEGGPYLYWIAIALFGLAAAWGVKRHMGRGDEERIVYTDEPVVRFEKELDLRNRLALISYKGRNYLVILGSNVTLLDSFGAGPHDKERFEEMARKLQETFSPSSELEEEDSPADPIEEYKKKASGTD